MSFPREQIWSEHLDDFRIYDQAELAKGERYGTEAFRKLYGALNNTIDASPERLGEALGELRRRCTEKVEARRDALSPAFRPRIQYFDLAAYLNSCKPVQ